MSKEQINYWDNFLAEATKEIFIKLHEHRCIDNTDRDFMIDESIQYASKLTERLRNFIENSHRKRIDDRKPTCSAENNDQIKLTNIPDSCGGHSSSDFMGYGCSDKRF